MPRLPAPGPERSPPGPPRTTHWGVVAFYALAALVLVILWQGAVADLGRRAIPYSEFKAHLACGEVVSCLVREDAIDGRIEPRSGAASPTDPSDTGTGPPAPSEPFDFTTVRVEDPGLVAQLAAAGVEFAGSRANPVTSPLLMWVLPLGFLLLLWFFLLRGAGGAAQGVMSFGKSRAKLVADRQVVIDSPDAAGREAILRVHARGKPLARAVDLSAAARVTPGFSGADLANATNEAALLAARPGDSEITQATLEAAIEKVVAGPERRSRRLGESEKRRVAFHEVGHAIVAAHCKRADPVRESSIVPRGRAALGYTLQLPTGDRNLLSRSELADRLRGLLGGRAAEEVIFGEVSTGAENDLEQAAAIARQAVCQYGMGQSAGLMHCAHRLGGIIGDVGGVVQRDCSEATAHAIDLEVRGMLDQAYADGITILNRHRHRHRHRDQLERIATSLLERETLDGKEFQNLLAGPGPQPSNAPDTR